MLSRVRRLLLPASLFLFPFLFYWKLFAGDPAERKIFRGDFLNQHYVWKSYALERVKRGELPFWNPHVLGGVPFHANPQVGLFYPPTYLLLPFHGEGRLDYLSLEAYQLLHQGWGGLGMWLLLTALGVNPAGALAGALIFMLTGFFTTPGHHALVLTASWIPLALHLGRKAVISDRLTTLAALSLALALMLLAGHPQPAYYGILLVSAWAIYQGGWRRAARRVLPALAVAAALASVQLVPTYQLARSSTRGGAGYAYASTFDFSPHFLSAALVPRGQIVPPGEDPSAPLHLYVGIGGLLLAAVALAMSRRRERWFFASTAVVALLLAMGADSFLFDLAYLLVPGFATFRIPFRLLGVFALSMAMLAAFGMDALLSAPSPRRRKNLSLVIKGGAAVLLLLAFWSAYAHTRLLADPGALGPERIERWLSGLNGAALLLALYLGLLLAFRWRSGRSWAAGGLLALLAIDLGVFVKDRGQHPWETLVRAGERPVHRVLRAQSDRLRYATDLNLESYAALHGAEHAGGQDSLVDESYAALLDLAGESANVLSLLNVKLVSGGAPASKTPWCGPRFPSLLPLLDVTPEISPLRLRFDPPVEAERLVIFGEPLGPGGGAVVDLGGAAYELAGGTPAEIALPERTTVEEIVVRVPEGSPGARIEDIEIDLNPIGLKVDFIETEGARLNVHCLPRAYFVARSESGGAPDRDPEIEDLRCWTLFDGVLIADPESGEAETGRLRAERVEILRYEPESVVITSHAAVPGFVVLADSFHSGWRAEVDGIEVPLLRAQHALRAVAVPEGKHEIRFLYRPLSFTLGLAASLLGLTAISVAAVLDRRTARMSA